jgi:uncharacterized protein
MEQGFFSTKGNRLLGALALVMLIIALASYAILNLTLADKGDITPTITVEGKGEVVAVPDIGTFSFSVEAEGETASVAQEQSGTKINEILSYLKEQGIEDKDVKTADYNLYPKYNYEDVPCAFGSYCPPREPVQDGFTVSQTVTVKVRKTDQAGALIAGVGERGATNISGLNFTVDDIEALSVEAREKAIADAKAKADILARDLGVKITRLVSFYESNVGMPMPYEAKGMEMSAVASDGDFGGANMPVGEESTTVTVSITYEIR